MDSVNDGYQRPQIQLKVDFLTFGDAADYLGVNRSTLRHWTNKLEELGVHYLERTSGGDRIYYPIDLEIMMFVKEIRQEHGRKSTFEAVASLIKDSFACRTLADRPELAIYQLKPDPVLQNIEIERLIENDQFRLLINSLVNEAAKNIIPSDLVEKLQDSFNAKLDEMQMQMDKKIEEIEEERSKKLDQLMKIALDTKKMQSIPGWKKFLGIGLKKEE